MKRKHLSIAAVFALTILSFGFNFGTAASMAQVNRPRVTATPTPPIAPPKASPTPNIAPTIQPTATPNNSPIQPPIQTLPELQAKIQSILARPALQRGSIGAKIVSLDTNRTIYEQNAEKYLMPASNMKSYTMAAAIEKLSPDFRFVTSVYATAAPDANGTIKGDLTVFGRGDISISYAFNDGDYYKGLDALADKIAQTGIKRVEGDLIGDETYFSGGAIPDGWEWDDLQWKSGAEISALPLNDNLLDLNVKPSSVAGAPCAVVILPFNPVMRVVNRCATSANGTARTLRIEKKLAQNILEISGTMTVGDKGFANFVTVSHPSEVFTALLKQRLQVKGVTITGQPRVFGATEKAALIAQTRLPFIEIAKLESPPLSVIAAKTLKPSQNTYTETILWTLGEEIGRKQMLNDAANASIAPDRTSSELGLSVVNKFLNEIGIAPDSVIQWDGSGLSRHNLITPASAVQLYIYMSKSRYADVWRDALPIGAVDGTLRNRFKNTIAANNVRAKTGTIDQVSSLSGYVTTAGGERLVISIIVNGVEDLQLRQSTIDEIIVALANFKGKS
ncbi:MAG: D-alanyl-D-alanine carboxypeptidase/D-alanyl-D-alanine-endopeptidase [Acidobacteriota bacterium]|nr:D-alanyl-D-alanine carboxypeptidase/D-alanyl-D-alanine-endopeptidase [Acidobacteriota bacterium]